jgi:hypothetical protein
MQTTDFGNREDRAERWRLDIPSIGSIFLEREVSAGSVIVREVRREDASKVALAENDDMVQALAPDWADESLREGVLPRALRGGENFSDADALHPLPEGVTVDCIAVAEEVGRRGVVWEGVDDLLSGPAGGRMLGDIEMDDSSAMMSEHDENEEYTQACRGNREEIEGDEISDMVGEERPPGLWRLRAPLRHQPGHGALTEVDAELEELGMDAWRTSQGIRRGHTPDQSLDFRIDGRATSGRTARELGPVLTKTTPLPSQHSVRSHDYEGLLPPGPDSGQPDPEEAINSAEGRPHHRSFVHEELLTQGQILESQLAVAAKEEGEKPKQVE